LVKKNTGNEEWYNDDYSEAVRKMIAARQTMINRDTGKGPKYSWNCKKKLFKIFIQV
jgi:hypothetical protein